MKTQKIKKNKKKIQIIYKITLTDVWLNGLLQTEKKDYRVKNNKVIFRIKPHKKDIVQIDQQLSKRYYYN